MSKASLDRRLKETFGDDVWVSESGKPPPRGRVLITAQARVEQVGYRLLGQAYIAPPPFPRPAAEKLVYDHACIVVGKEIDALCAWIAGR